MLAYAERDGVQGVMVVELGAQPAPWGGYQVPGVGDAAQAALLESVFELTWGKVAGYITEAPLGLMAFRGRPAEEVIGRWYTGNPDFTVIEDGPDGDCSGK